MARARDSKITTAIATVFALPTREEQLEAACALAADEAHQDIRELFHLWRDEKRKAMSRHDCKYEGNWGDTSQVEKEKGGILRTFFDGKKKLITPSSFYQHLITRLILSHPRNGPAPRGTATSTRFGVRKGTNVMAENSGAA
jgi:hypothetical protein